MFQSDHFCQFQLPDHLPFPHLTFCCLQAMRSERYEDRSQEEVRRNIGSFLGEGTHPGNRGAGISIATHLAGSPLQREENEPKPESSPSLTVVQ